MMKSKACRSRRRQADLLPRILLLVAMTLLTGSAAFAEGDDEAVPAGGSISGYVADKESGEKLIGAVVAIRGTKLGAVANTSGYYVIKSIPAGKYTLAVSSLGYETLEMEFEFREGEAQRFNFELTPAATDGETVTVTAEREEERREISVSKVQIPVEQLAQLRIGGEADVFRALQFLPGVLTSSQISSGLYIRGGSPDQNLVLIDGATVYNPSHLLGFFSTFNPDAIKDVDLIKGAYPAEYGGRLSAVLDLRQKDGNINEFEGVASLGLVSSRLSLQGPIGAGSFFIGGRRTYLDLITGLLPDDPENPFPDFKFYDLNAKITQTLSENDVVQVSGFTSADDLGLEGSGIDFNLGISNYVGSLRWTHTFAPDLFFVLLGSGSRYRSGFNGNNSGFIFEAKNTITDFTGKARLEWYQSDKLTIKTGVDATRYRFNYFQNFSGDSVNVVDPGTNEDGQVNLIVNDWTLAGYAQANYNITDLISMQGGVRTDYFDLSGTVTVDPRVALRWRLTDRFALKAGWGIYHQYLRLATQPDFSFFDTWMPTDSTVVPSDAVHYVLSAETEPFAGIDLSVDVYYKKLHNISELINTVTKAEDVDDIFYSGEGEAYGAEIFFQKKAGRLVGWLGYGLGWVNSRFDSINGGVEFRPKYDRRHDLKVVAQYKLSEHWDVGASFTFQSGQSYTGATSRFRSTLPDGTGEYDLIVPSQRYGLRLPASHQLNLNVNYNSTLFGLPMRLLLDIYNVYSRRDIWFRFYDTDGQKTEVTDVRLLPIIPTIALEVSF